MPEIPTERRTYYPLPRPEAPEARPCPYCGRLTFVPWYLSRDRERHVWRRWVCRSCQGQQDLPEEESA